MSVFFFMVFFSYEENLLPRLYEKSVVLSDVNRLFNKNRAVVPSLFINGKTTRINDYFMIVIFAKTVAVCKTMWKILTGNRHDFSNSLYYLRFVLFQIELLIIYSIIASMLLSKETVTWNFIVTK